MSSLWKKITFFSFSHLFGFFGFFPFCILFLFSFFLYLPLKAAGIYFALRLFLLTYVYLKFQVETDILEKETVLEGEVIDLTDLKEVEKRHKLFGVHGVLGCQDDGGSCGSNQCSCFYSCLCGFVGKGNTSKKKRAKFNKHLAMALKILNSKKRKVDAPKLVCNT